MRRMYKSSAEYMEVFEDLMRYTSFKSSDDLKTKQDLFDFFKDVQDNANKRGRGFRITRNMIAKFGNAFSYMKGRGLETIQNPNERIKRSKKVFKSYNVAKERGYVVKVNDVDVYKSLINLKGKEIVRWRDSKGRFVKAPNKEE